MKRYIAQKKEFKVNWAIVACRTSKLVIQTKTSGGPSKGSSLLQLDQFEGSNQSFGASNASNVVDKAKDNQELETRVSELEQFQITFESQLSYLPFDCSILFHTCSLDLTF